MNKRLLLVSGIIGLAALYRLLPHSYNFTPVGAMALVGGMYLGKRYLAFLLPILSLYASDLILNNTINRAFITDQTGFVFFADYMIFVYGAFLLTVVLGIALSKKGVASKILVGTITSSLLFFFVTNFGSWLTGAMYPKTFAGLVSAIGAGIPFFDKTLLANVIFVPMFVLTIEWLTKAKTSKELSTETINL